MQMFFNMELLNQKLLEIDVSTNRILQVYKLLYKQGQLFINKQLSNKDYYKINYILINELLKICNFKNEQNDAHEFLIKMLDDIVIKKIKKYYSFIFNKIGFCNNCKKEINYEHLIDNWMSFDEIKTECDSYTRECKICKNDVKIYNKNIHFPEYILMYNMNNGLYQNFQIKDNKYQLHCLLCHIGNQNSGHYFIIVNYLGLFYKIDDTSCSKIDIDINVFLKRVNITTIMYKKI